MMQTLTLATKPTRWLAPLTLSLLALWGCGGSSGDDPVAIVNPPVLPKPCVQAVGTTTVVVGSGLPGDPAIPEPQ